MSSTYPFMTFLSSVYDCASRLLADLHGQHRDRSAIHSFHRKPDVVVPARGTEHVQQRQVVVGRRNRPQRVLAERTVIDERRVLAFDEEIARDGLEAYGPIVGLDALPTPRVGMQVVHEIAAA